MSLTLTETPKAGLVAMRPILFVGVLTLCILVTQMCSLASSEDPDEMLQKAAENFCDFSFREN